MNPLKAALAALIAMAAAACSEATPVGPTTAPGDVSLSVQSQPGTYTLDFLKETCCGLQPANDVEPVGTYLVLKSEIRDSNGNLAQTGSVTYEYCAVGRQAAPSADCASGAGSWKRYWSGSVDSVGDLVGYGACSTPRTIGFRVSYSGKNSGIASGRSAPKDFTWQ